MKIENEIMKNKDENKNERNAEIIRLFGIEGAPQHNRSLRWLVQQASSMGARFNPYSDYRHDRYGSTFEIEFEAKRTGIRYKLDVTMYPRIADLVAARISQADLSSPGASASLEPMMSRIFEVRGGWWDLAHREWISFCVDNDADLDPITAQVVWPADRILAIIIALRDDYRTSLDPEQYSLRMVLEKALPMYWLAGMAPEEMDFQQLTAMTMVSNLAKGRTDITSREIREIGMAMLTDPEPDYSAIISEIGERYRSDDEDDEDDEGRIVRVPMTIEDCNAYLSMLTATDERPTPHIPVEEA